MTQPTPKHIHLIGICGTAMASLAGMLRAQGHRVTGSDAASYPPMNGMLADLNIPILEPYAEQNLQPHPDLVVVGNAISRGNPELEYVLDHRLPLTSMAALLHAEFLAGRETLVVAGTHGKTTTTSMLAWIYQVASHIDPKFTPSFLIGGIAENFRASFQISSTNTFLIEGDEYDTAFFDKGPKFLHYFPHAAILTHVEFDHADIYADLDQVKTAFRRFVNLIPRSGRLVAFDASPNVSDCIRNAFCTVERYGFAPSSHWRLTDLKHAGLKHAGLKHAGLKHAGLKHAGSQTTWTLHRAGVLFAHLTLPMAGEHNALNATAAVALAASQGVPTDAIVEALRTFESVKRRLEVVAVVAGITVIDDFAHHPTAIRETLRALRSAYPGCRLWAVLEPRSNTLRRRVFEADLVDALAAADQVMVASVFRSEAIPEHDRLHPESVVTALQAQGTPATAAPDADAIVAYLAQHTRPGDVVAILSNGAFGSIYTKLPQALEAAHRLTPAVTSAS